MSLLKFQLLDVIFFFYISLIRNLIVVFMKGLSLKKLGNQLEHLSERLLRMLKVMLLMQQKKLDQQSKLDGQFLGSHRLGKLCRNVL